jgi:nitrite reductase/ring-hydroxylating ferredoxin subunit
MNLQDQGDGSQTSQTDRRTFCAGLLLTSTGLMLAPPNVTQAVTPQESALRYPPRRIEGAELLLPGSSLYFNYPTRNDPALLLRFSDNEFRAFSRRCSHAGCSVEFDGPSRCLRCPCHRGAYDARMGNVVLGPPRRPLDEIVLEMRAGGQIWAVGRTLGTNAEIVAEDLKRR